MTEAAWRDTVIDIAHTYGWKVFCVTQSAREGKRMKWVRDRKTGQPKQVPVMVSNVMADSEGWPDLFLARPREPQRLVALELKTESGKVSEAQEYWLMVLDYCGVQTMVVRPSDVDAVHELLK